MFGEAEVLGGRFLGGKDKYPVNGLDRLGGCYNGDLWSIRKFLFAFLMI